MSIETGDCKLIIRPQESEEKNNQVVTCIQIEKISSLKFIPIPGNNTIVAKQNI